MIQKIRPLLGNKLKRWAHRRHGNQSSPQHLAASRIYIIPSKSGIVFSLMLFVMLVGSMNYNNNMGLTLTFLLGSFMLVAMHQCHRNLLSLRVDFDNPEPVFAGQFARVPVTLTNNQRHRRVDIRISVEKSEHLAINLNSEQSVTTFLRHPTDQRGRYDLERLRLGCRYPGGLFSAWTWVYWDTSMLVYPHPDGHIELPTAMAGDQEGVCVVSAGDDELGELRDYQLGDNLSRIAWKQAARSENLLSKTFEDSANEEMWLNWSSLQSLSVEARLSQLCQWIIQADQSKRRYGLRLPQKQLNPDVGAKHTALCLTELALYP